MNRRQARNGLIAACLLATADVAAWSFTETGLSAGARLTHGFTFGMWEGEQMMTGGAAGGDLDGDGDIDLVVLRGGIEQAGGSLSAPTVLLNDGSAHFEASATSGLATTHLPVGAIHNGAYLVDLDADGDLDLLLGAINAPAEVWLNNGEAVFVRLQPNPFASIARDTWGVSLAPLDEEPSQSLDLIMSHWTMDMSGLGSATPGHVWRQTGALQFVDETATACCAALLNDQDHTFTASIGRLDDNVAADLAWAGDFGTSRLLAGNGAMAFVSAAPMGLPNDENGMGSALGDFDNDGDLDWFVTSIFDPTPPSPEDPDGNWGRSGNRLYRNEGATWSEVSQTAGVREGGWGWGACARDFDLDGDLDLYHVNGFFGAAASEFHQDPARMFVNDGQGQFVEQAGALGVADTGQGRAIVCADFDRDGDVDIFLQNSGDTLGPDAGFSRLLINDAATTGRGISLVLRQPGGNLDAVLARIELVDSSGHRQMRELEAGGNFLGSHPIEAHFGLPPGVHAVSLRVRWPNGDQEWFAPSDATRTILLKGEGADLWMNGFE